MKNSTRLKNGAVQAVLLRQKMGEKLEKIAQKNHQPHNKITLENHASETAVGQNVQTTKNVV